MLPGIGSADSYDGNKSDYSAVVDSSTDRTAAGANPETADVAAMTHTALRAWARLTVKAAGTAPTLVAHDETWGGNPVNAAPIAARTSAGVLTLTWPATVYDEIPSGVPGATSAGFAINLRAAFANDRGGTTWASVKAIPTSANVVTIYFWKFSGGAPVNGDPASDTDVDVFAI